MGTEKPKETKNNQLVLIGLNRFQLLTKRNQTKPKETKKNRVERVERVRVRERERVRGRVRVEAFAAK